MGEGRGGGLRAAKLVPSSVVHLHPEDAVMQAMLMGWRAQMASRSLTGGTVESRLSAVQRFADFSGEYPWQWRAGDVDDWSAELRGRGLSSSTLRAYQGHLRLFCDYLVDPRYEWGQLCWERFGSHPVQVCHEWNTTAHVVEVEARPQVRPLTRARSRRSSTTRMSRLRPGPGRAARGGRRRGATPPYSK